MKTSLRIVAITTLTLGTAIGGCSQHPQDAINLANQAIEEARKHQAAQYAPEFLKLAEDQNRMAHEEMNLQDNEFALRRNYEIATELLNKAKWFAEQAITEAAANKLNSKAEAELAIRSAKKTLNEVQLMLAQAPTGKGTRTKLRALQADIQVAQIMFKEVETSMNGEHYLEARTKAESARVMLAKWQDRDLPLQD